MNLETLLVPLILDTSKFEDGINKAISSSKGLGDKLTGIGSTMTKGLTAPILGAVGGAIYATQNWADTLDSLGDVLGTSADDSAALAVAIQTVGGDTEGITAQMAKLTKGLVDSNGKIGASGQLLKDMGVAFQDANGNMLPATEILTSVADKLAAMPDGLEKTRIMTELFGKSGKDLSDTMNALANGGLETARQKASDLGLLMGDKGVNSSIEMGKAAETMKLSMQGLAVTVGTTLIPLITPLIEKITEGVKWFSNMPEPIKKIILVVGGLLAVAGPLITVIGGIISAFTTIIPIITAVAGVISFPLIAIVLAIIGVIVLVATAWKNNWGDIQGKVQAVIDWMKPFIDNGLKAIQLIFKAFKDLFTGNWKALGEDIKKIWQLAVDNWKRILDTFKNIDWGKIGKDIVRGIGDGIGAMAGWLAGVARRLAQAALDAIKRLFGISSPSLVFKEQVGVQMAKGLMQGFEDEMDKFDINTRFNTNITTKSPVYVQFQYAPTFSLADQYEAEQTLRPVIENVMRKI